MLQLSVVDILVQSGSSGHSDQDGYDGSMVRGHQKGHRIGPDLRLHVIFGGIVGTWASTYTSAVVGPGTKTWFLAVA